MAGNSDSRGLASVTVYGNFFPGGEIPWFFPAHCEAHIAQSTILDVVCEESAIGKAIALFVGLMCPPVM